MKRLTPIVHPLVGRVIARRAKLYLEPALETDAGKAAADFRKKGDEASAILMDRIAVRPRALWVGTEWTPDPAGTVDRALTVAVTKRRVIVVYSIVGRDGDADSAGGCKDAAAYRAFVAGVAAGIKGRAAIVVLEPDALAMAHDDLDATATAERVAMISEAVDVLAAVGAKVYIDAGSSAWVPAGPMATLLRRAGVDRATGAALNVSHHETTADILAYADELRTILGSLRVVVDVSRNGQGPPADGSWRNVPGMGLGVMPTLSSGHAGCDGLVDVKIPGTSDGEAGGWPKAGAWYLPGALELCRNAV